MKIDIAFDIDDVMIRFIDPVLEILKSLKYTYESTGNFDLFECIKPQISKEHLHRIFRTVYTDPYCFPIVAGAQELCTKLYLKTGDPILFITTRNTDIASETHGLVQRFCKVPYVVAFANTIYDKITYLRDINYFVEDRRKTILHLVENGKTVFVPKRSWNDTKEHDSIVYINDIGDLIKSINLFVK